MNEATNEVTNPRPQGKESAWYAVTAEEAAKQLVQHPLNTFNNYQAANKAVGA
ncbi:hypothetical protein OKW41_000238 [Paraburkholderia sp. UCT70]